MKQRIQSTIICGMLTSMSLCFTLTDSVRADVLLAYASFYDSDEPILCLTWAEMSDDRARVNAAGDSCVSEDSSGKAIIFANPEVGTPDQAAFVSSDTVVSQDLVARILHSMLSRREPDAFTRNNSKGSNHWRRGRMEYALASPRPSYVSSGGQFVRTSTGNPLKWLKRLFGKTDDAAAAANSARKVLSWEKIYETAVEKGPLMCRRYSDFDTRAVPLGVSIEKKGSSYAVVEELWEAYRRQVDPNVRHATMVCTKMHEFETLEALIDWIKRRYQEPDATRVVEQLRES